MDKSINNKTKLIYYISLLLYIVIMLRLTDIIIINNNKYEEDYNIKTGMIYKGEEMPRGCIYDRNGILLVGNKEIKTLKYKKTNLSTKEEINLARQITKNIKIDEVITLDYIKSLYKNIPSNITQEELNVSYIYSLMNKGYYNEDKIIKENLTEEDITKLKLNNNLYITNKYERDYKDKSLRTIYGKVGNIRKEDKEYYLNNNYYLSDNVGISYLEKQYEKYLKPINNLYKVNAYNERINVNEKSKGKDLFLTIDINLQKDIETIIENEMIKAKEEPNTNLFNKSYVIISNAYDGSIYAFIGKEINKNKFIDNNLGLVTDAVVPGSSIKAASHIVGYHYGTIYNGLTMNDSCIKIKNLNKKCSWRPLGMIDDLDALKYSSNYYQYMSAIKLGKGNYIYNDYLNVDPLAIKKYRQIFNEFGLGVKTGIDLPYESIGFIGDDSYSLSLLDFPIGEYDTYTPVQMNQYISTIYNNGTRVSPHLGYYIKDNNDITYIKRNILGGVNTSYKHFDRVKLGLKKVMEPYGTASGYINIKYNPIGKTGTADSFIDTNLDGKVDTKTISTSFVGVANGITFTVLTPNVSDLKTSYTSRINKRITRKVSDLFFEKYYNDIIKNN